MKFSSFLLILLFVKIAAVVVALLFLLEELCVQIPSSTYTQDMLSLVEDPENCDTVINLSDGSHVTVPKAILLANCNGEFPKLVAAARQNGNGKIHLTLDYIDQATMSAILGYFCCSEFSGKFQPDLKLLKGNESTTRAIIVLTVDQNLEFSENFQVNRLQSKIEEMAYSEKVLAGTRFLFPSLILFCSLSSSRTLSPFTQNREQRVSDECQQRHSRYYCQLPSGT